MQIEHHAFQLLWTMPLLVLQLLPMIMIMIMHTMVAKMSGIFGLIGCAKAESEKGCLHQTLLFAASSEAWSIVHALAARILHRSAVVRTCGNPPSLALWLTLNQAFEPVQPFYFGTKVWFPASA